MLNKTKQFVKTQLPFAVYFWRIFRNRSIFLIKSPERRFAAIYQNNTWKDPLSRSGPGSNLSETEVIRSALPLVVRELNCQSILDLPCGDYFWMKLVDLDIKYTGGDIVAELVRNNQNIYGDYRRKFIKLDIVKDKLPKADLVLCRDCLVHLPNKAIFRALKNIKESGSTYFLTTTFTRPGANANILTGDWRPINLQKPPFGFPLPIKLIDEKCPAVGFSDKNLGLWRVAEIPDYE